MSEFTKKSVLVTGAGRGDGCETALALGADGAKAGVNHARSATQAEQSVMFDGGRNLC